MKQNEINTKRLGSRVGSVVRALTFHQCVLGLIPGPDFTCGHFSFWLSGESARLPPMCPGFDSRTRRHMWTEFVGSLLCSERFFSGYSFFPLYSKTNI